MLLKIILLFFAVDKTLADSSPSLCCSGDNILLDKFCSDNKKVALECPTKYILDPSIDSNEAYHINQDGMLVYPSILTNEDIAIPKHEYCLTSLDSKNGSKVAVVCYFAEAHENETKFYGIRGICAFISVVFLILTLIVYYMVPELRDLQGKCIIHVLVALSLAFTILGILQFVQFGDIGCLVASYCNYIAFMLTFFWLNVTSFHVWKTVVTPEISGTEKQWYKIYLTYGYGMPFLFLLFVVIAHHTPGDHLKPGFAESTCWFANRNATWAYFYGPISVLLTINLILFIWSAVILKTTNRTLSTVHFRSLKYKVTLYLRLFLIMGLLWFFEVLSAALENVYTSLNYVWMITDYINVFQGVIIFMLLVVLRKRALRGLANKGFCFFQFPGMWKTLEDQEVINQNETEVENHLTDIRT